MTRVVPPVAVGARRSTLSFWDLVACLLVLGALVFLAETGRELLQPLPKPGMNVVTLDPSMLPEYAARTTLRMLAAMVLSILFTFTYATWAAKSRRAEVVLLPLLDILQSVPILGFISVTVVFFMSLAPGVMLGAELAAVFAIFTSQAWNMAFSFYQSLRTIPEELTEVARSFRINPWMRFWRIEVPFAMPALVWNMMMSMSGGWFFVVASEAISVGGTTVTLPGIGSYIALAIERRDLGAICWAIAAMLLVILTYDQLLFRPLVAWADRFRFEREAGLPPPRSWVLTMLTRSRLIAEATAPLVVAWRWTYRVASRPPKRAKTTTTDERTVRGIDRLWHTAVIAVAAFAVWIGLRPGVARIAQPAAQFMAAFPANLFFPFAVSTIVAFRLDPNIWLSPLMILGTQWYILFNVIAGASGIPSELRDIAKNLRLRGWLWWRRIALPAVFPFYVTGAITASGGSWNASIVAEVVSWGRDRLQAYGLGAYIADATEKGDIHRIVLGVAVMSLFVVVLNRLFWRPLYRHAERKFRLA